MNKQLFEKLLLQENNFLKSQFLSPVVRNKPVRVRIDGIILVFTIDFTGWGVFQPISYKQAKFVRSPTLKEKTDYLNLFPILRLIICRREGNNWYGSLAHADSRFKITGLIPIFLPEELRLFEVIRIRFDGQLCWFDSLESKYNPKNAVYLRESLNNELNPQNLTFSGLTQEERDAYSICFNDLIESKKDHTEERIKSALAHSGAKFRNYVEREHTFTIEFSVDGEFHRSTVNKTNLQIQSAGICLSGGDSNFDLQSLVNIIREGQQTDRIHRVGDNFT